MTDETPKTRRKITPLFVPDPDRPGREYAEYVDPFGRPQAEGERPSAESPEAASQWDARHWRRGMIRP